MHIAVIIPFRGDPATLLWALAGFQSQQLPPGMTLEVRICGDGMPVPPLPASQGPIRFTSISSPRVGVAEAKNLLLRNNPADVVIFANSDTRPISTFVQAHAARLLSLPPNYLVLGSAPYELPSSATVFDALKEDTPMIFFYNQLPPHTPCDFRHCWTLNLSARYADLERINFFNPRFRPYGFEDLDLGFRLMGPSAKSIYFDPAAQVIHRHPMTFDDYLNREELLGVMSPVLYDANPALYQKLHGTSSPDQLANQFRTWLELDRSTHGWIYQRLQEWNALPQTILDDGPARHRLLMTLYQMHIPLKRLAFRLGFLHGLNLRDETRWQERTAQGLWRKIVEPLHELR
jgi:hypothetical protein